VQTPEPAKASDRTMALSVFFFVSSGTLMLIKPLDNFFVMLRIRASYFSLSEIVDGTLRGNGRAVFTSTYYHL